MKLRLILVIALIALVGPGSASAMSIYLFSKMKNPDRATYLDNMVEGAAKMLRDQGHPDQSQKVLDLFGDAGPNGGVSQFVTKLKDVDSENRRNAINPNNRKPVLQVEDALALMLKDNGVIVPVGYLLSVNRNFMPAAPNIQQIINQGQ
jgi:hypothetical protein